jgi:hypothetical protein
MYYRSRARWQRLGTVACTARPRRIVEGAHLERLGQAPFGVTCASLEGTISNTRALEKTAPVQGF